MTHSWSDVHSQEFSAPLSASREQLANILLIAD
jgi:hypothetical protein